MRGKEYYVGAYFWRLDKDTDRVGIFTVQEDGTEVWDESENFQELKKWRFEPWIRWISKDKLLKEARSRPFAVRDGNVVRFQKDVVR